MDAGLGGGVGEQRGGGRSTVSLRAPPLPGPARAAKITASASRRCAATSSTSTCSRSQTTGVGAGGAQGAGLVGVADQADGGVAAVGEVPLQQQGDLAVASGDDDAHTPNLPGAAALTFTVGQPSAWCLPVGVTGARRMPTWSC